MIYKSLEGYLTTHDLLKPDSHLRIVEAHCSVQQIEKTIHPQEGHSADVSRSLIAIHERVIEGNTNHVERSLRNKVSASVVGGILRTLNRALQQATLAQECPCLN